VPLILLLAAGLAVVNLLLLAVGTRLFERESILTRWN
jgi:hypothetical protein